ncbi:MAG TPA: methyl-accepting chemotaxis protein [Acidobacteriota bacterium]|nr:methyl-accepting chemotaxis protein [Acidobacteriota bacterium]
MKITFIGGGNAAVILLNYFSTLEEAEVRCVVDLLSDAPAMRLAREMGIATTNDMERGISKADVVIEVTGSSKVQAELRQMLKPGQNVMTSGCAKMMIDMIEAQAEMNSTTLDKISGEFRSLTDILGGAIDKVDNALDIIHAVLREMQIVTLNANIEAARAGDNGRAFLKVVERMREMLKRTGDATDSIEGASGESHRAVGDLAKAEARMQDAFNLLDGNGRKGGAVGGSLVAGRRPLNALNKAPER